MSNIGIRCSQNFAFLEYQSDYYGYSEANLDAHLELDASAALELYFW